MIEYPQRYSQQDYKRHRKGLRVYESSRPEEVATVDLPILQSTDVIGILPFLVSSYSLEHHQNLTHPCYAFDLGYPPKAIWVEKVIGSWGTRADLLLGRGV